MARPSDALAIEVEMRKEQASALGHTAEKLELALAKLAAFDRAPDSTRAPGERARLRDAARQAVWYVIVQREAMGLHHHDAVRQLYAIPDEVWRFMGAGRR